MKLSVLLVDDDKLIHNVLKKSLKDIYDLHHAYNGDEGIAKAIEFKPNVIILDVEMPGRNGYETCELLKSNPETQPIPVIFCSSRGETRNRMLGYEAGAEDFLVKPFENEELLAKLQIQEKLHQGHSAIKDERRVAQDTAMSAMTATSEMGRVIQFVELTYGMNNPKTLSQKLFELLETLDLNASVMFNFGQSVALYSSSGEPSPLESELLRSCHEHGRFIDFGCRTIINYPRISLLIKNMPLDNLEKYGRLKDLFPAVMGATDAKLRMMETDIQLKKQAENTDTAFKAIRKQLFDLVNGQLKTQQVTLDEFQQWQNEFNWELPKLNLEEDQELFISKYVERMLQKAQTIFEKNIQDHSSTLSVLDQMKALTQQLEEIIQTSQEEVLFAQGEEISLEDADQSGYDMDVELF